MLKVILKCLLILIRIVLFKGGAMKTKLEDLFGEVNSYLFIYLFWEVNFLYGELINCLIM